MSEPPIRADALRLPTQGVVDIALSDLIDALCADGEERGRDFVRGVGAWLDRHRTRISLPMADELGVDDVVVTLQMRRGVKLVVTGFLRANPAEVTLAVRDADFTEVFVRLHAADRDAPYDFCTLDYAVEGLDARLLQDVRSGSDDLAAGEEVTCLVASTHGDARLLRVRRSDGQTVTVPFDAVEIATTPQ